MLLDSVLFLPTAAFASSGDLSSKPVPERVEGFGWFHKVNCMFFMILFGPFHDVLEDGSVLPSALQLY